MVLPGDERLGLGDGERGPDLYRQLTLALLAPHKWAHHTFAIQTLRSAGS
jgi:hypothetical protein